MLTIDPGAMAPMCDTLNFGGMTPACVLADDGTLLCVNQAAIQLLGRSRHELEATNLCTLIGQGMGNEAAAFVRRAVTLRRELIAMGVSRGHWIRGKYTPVEWGQQRACLIVTVPWVGPMGERLHSPDWEVIEHQHHDLADLGVLSVREAEVLWRLARDQTVPEIAREVSRSVKTIEAHIRSLTAKTGRSGRLALAQLAIERSLIHMSECQVQRVFRRDRALPDADRIALN